MITKFPQIQTIYDVLPAIRGYDEIAVIERDYGMIINYIIALKETFAGDDLNASLRRECRGLIFDKQGKIVSRPYHKFFNLGEREETFLDSLDFSAAHSILEKLDGSMVRPVRNEKSIWCMATRMGITDVALQVDIWLNKQQPLGAFDQHRDFFDACEREGITPIFEWCSRKQRIVCDHPIDRLVLTAMRYNENGSYLTYDWMKANAFFRGFDCVKFYPVETVNSILEQAKTEKQLEGWVIRWNNGNMVKVKLDWYVDLHKTKEAIAREKYVIEMILDGNIDDVKPKLQGEDRERVEKFEKDFTSGLNTRINTMQTLYNNTRQFYADKKDFALGTNMSYEPWERAIIFAVWNGKCTIAEAVVNTIRSHIKSQPDIDRNRHIWYGASYNYQKVDLDG